MINEVYLNSEIKSDMIEFFTQNGFIQLNNFLDKKFIEFKLNLMNEKFIQVSKEGTYKKKNLNLKEVYKFEIIEIIEFFKSKQFIEFIEDITECDIFLSNLEVNMYGCDDFVNFDNEPKREDIISIIFDMSDDWDEKQNEGVLSYVTGDEEIFYLDPSANTLSIMYKPQDVTRYLRKIQGNTENRKILRVEMDFSIEE